MKLFKATSFSMYVSRAKTIIFRNMFSINVIRATWPGFLETNLSQNSDLSLRFYSNLRNLQQIHFSKKELAQILTQLEKKLKSIWPSTTDANDGTGKELPTIGLWTGRTHWK